MVTEYVFSEVNVMLRDIVYKLLYWHLSAVETLIEWLQDTDFSKLYSFF